jgi:hypothetical protein
MTQAAESSVWSGHMFGLAVHSSVPVAGCEPSPAPCGAPTTCIQATDRREVLRALPRDAQAIGWRTEPDGRRVADVLAHPEAGYRLPAPGFGIFHISAPGTRILAAPNAIADWRWQRYLIGRVLPFAALLQGLEPLHASALGTASGGAVLLAGEPGAGKSTLAAALMLGGLSFMADDVVALQTQDGVVHAHVGADLLSLRPASVARLGAAAVRRVGRRVGADATGVRLAVARPGARLPVRAIYFLTAPGQAPAQRSPDGPGRLLGATFNAVIRDPARVVRQLDICATLARTVPITELSISRDEDPRAVADRILGELHSSAQMA